MEKKIATLALFTILTLSMAVTLTSVANAFVASRTYTLDADFDEGILVGVEHETVHDQLQLSKQVTTLPFLWVPNNDGTVSKVDAETGRELGRYRVAPPELPLGGNPSRTTVDLRGNCWVGCRQAGTVVKIGLYEAGEWIDRNGDGICETSHDANGDGYITGDEILPWGQDECVLFEVVLIAGHEGTYTPGTYLGPYDTDYWGVAPRGLAVDAYNNLWAGTWSTSKYYYIDGETGAILKTIDVSAWGHHAYGAVMDAKGILWSSGQAYNHILRIDPSTDPPTISRLDIGHFVYGLGLDYAGHLFVTGWDSSTLSKVDITKVPPVIEWTYYKPELYCSRGVVCTSDNDVWVAVSGMGTVNRYDNDGNLKAIIYVGNEPTGVGVDAAGKVWVCVLGDEYIHRIDPATNTIELSKRIVGSGGHYTYSDFTGIISRTITTRIGTWTVVFDSEAADTPWGTLSWHSLEPDGTSITVRARSSNDKISWSTWENAKNGVPLSATPNGRYLQIETTFQIFTGEVSPVLYDLTVETAKIPVYVDIKPGSWPNPINIGSKGVFAVAICGTKDFNVTTIDPATVKIYIEGVEDGVVPLRWSYEDVATPWTGEAGGGHALGGDGYLDLVFHFDTQAVVTGLGLDEHVGETIPLIIMGNLYEEFGGTPIIGQDYARIQAPWYMLRHLERLI
jgi:streptogramin lyase